MLPHVIESAQNKVENIDEATVQRICQATGLQLSQDVSLEDASYHLGHLRDYYWYQVKHLPKMRSTELKNSTNKMIKGGRRLVDLLLNENHRVFQDAIRAAALDRWNDSDGANKAIADVCTSLKKLIELSDHLARKKDEYNQSSPQAKIGWPLQGRGNRALFPYLCAHTKTRVSPSAAARDLIDNYIPAVYHLFFPGRTFTATNDAASGNYSGPAVRFAFSVFKELKLGERKLDAKFMKQIAERSRSEKKKRTKRLKSTEV